MTLMNESWKMSQGPGRLSHAPGVTQGEIPCLPSPVYLCCPFSCTLLLAFLLAPNLHQMCGHDTQVRFVSHKARSSMPVSMPQNRSMLFSSRTQLDLLLRSKSNVTFQVEKDGHGQIQYLIASQVAEAG